MAQLTTELAQNLGEWNVEFLCGKEFHLQVDEWILETGGILITALLGSLLLPVYSKELITKIERIHSKFAEDLKVIGEPKACGNSRNYIGYVHDV